MFAECLEVMVDVLSAGRARKGCNIEAWLLAQCLHGNVSLTAQISPLRREHGLSEITVGLRQGGGRGADGRASVVAIAPTDNKTARYACSNDECKS